MQTTFFITSILGDTETLEVFPSTQVLPRETFLNLQVVDLERVEMENC